MAPGDETRSRRELIVEGVRTTCLIAASGLIGGLASRPARAGTVWQIDPTRCSHCGKCATECVIDPSAVKCVHTYEICGFCKLCFGLLLDKRTGNTPAAEDVRCPTDALRTTFLEHPYYEIFVVEPLCIGCARCVKGCEMFGNGSLYLQIRHDRCVNCNQCAIASACPAQAIKRVPVSQPYYRRGVR
ncbi:MAG TPA: hypothetical protein VLH79_02150 [Chthonomonadales bacterium]|nr:hypothetical protein [Chthonomonadales bacterium]